MHFFDGFAWHIVLRTNAKCIALPNTAVINAIRMMSLSRVKENISFDSNIFFAAMSVFLIQV